VPRSVEATDTALTQLSDMSGERAKPILPESGAIRNTRGIAPFYFSRKGHSQ